MSKKKPDQVADNPNILPYASNVGAPVIKPNDLTSFKQEKLLKTNTYFKSKYENHSAASQAYHMKFNTIIKAQSKRITTGSLIKEPGIKKSHTIMRKNLDNECVVKTDINPNPETASNGKKLSKDISWASIAKSSNNRSTALKPKYDTSTEKRTSLTGSTTKFKKSRNYGNVNKNWTLVARSNKHSVISKSVFQKNKKKQAKRYRFNNNDFPALS